MRISYILFISFIICLILYLSWTTSPKLGALWFIPKWVASWTDTNNHNNIRTSVPFVWLGTLSGISLLSTYRKWYWWLMTFLGMIVIVLIAEIGQLFLPGRTFDWFDVVWGIAGSIIGLIFAKVLIELRNLLNEYV